jgi:large subunit ribosomal protein L22
MIVMKKYIAKASLKMIRTSSRKLSLVASFISGMDVSKARTQLSFLKKKKIATDVKKCLDSAIANAENNHGINIDQLFVKTITVGKAVVLKRLMFRGRGKSSSICKKFSNLYITLEEKLKV